MKLQLLKTSNAFPASHNLLLCGSNEIKLASLIYPTATGFIFKKPLSVPLGAGITVHLTLQCTGTSAPFCDVLSSCGGALRKALMASDFHPTHFWFVLVNVSPSKRGSTGEFFISLSG